jgi:hypothetical protein
MPRSSSSRGLDPEKINNWADFQNLLDSTNEENLRIRRLNRRNRIQKRIFMLNPYQLYPLTSVKNQINRTTDPSQKAVLNKWGVRVADLDDDSATPDNVILFSDVDAGKIQAMDGFHIVPAQHKNQLRATYGAFPTQEARSIMTDDPD